MITVDEAQRIIRESLSSLAPARRSLLEAARCVLAEDVYATLDIPAFAQSSMDGYAFRFADKESPLAVIGEMAAGTTKTFTVGEGQATRIFTGAPLPAGADTVVMQEKVSERDGFVHIDDAALKQGSNVRPCGSEIMKGQLALAKGALLTPAAIGFLAGLGRIDALVTPLPSVTIIVTGKELAAPGKPLLAGQVYESNSFLLRVALQRININNPTVLKADDDLESLKTLLNQALTQSDLVLLTGGVSVGDYDFVVEATKLCGVTQCFHKVKQRPGKPLYFGTKEGKAVFGLPGNPSSVLSCFYNYVLLAIETLSGNKCSLQTTTAVLAKSVAKPAGLTQFLKGKLEHGKALPLGAQESFQLSSFAQANCLIRLEEGRVGYSEGERVDLLLLHQ